MGAKAIYMIVICCALLLGWVIGSVYPITIWPNSNCHRLGGAIRSIDGLGKPAECVIPWQEH